MQEVGNGLLAGAGVMAFVAASKFRPLLTVRRGLLLLRAACLVVPIGARAAWVAMVRSWPDAMRYAKEEA